MVQQRIRMSTRFIDINADLGESDGGLTATDVELMRFISSANIACGGHAGDEKTMRQALRLAQELSVAVGAHPAYPDRKNFGRLELALSAAQIETCVYEQLMRLNSVAESLGIALAHVKPHGALYHAASGQEGVALAIASAVKQVNPGLILVGQVGSAALRIWRTAGCRCAAEAFADRAYEPDGSLRRRTLPGALLEHPELAARQALNIATRGMVLATDGSELALQADTICIHSDTPGSATISAAVRARLGSAGVTVRALPTGEVAEAGREPAPSQTKAPIQ